MPARLRPQTRRDDGAAMVEFAFVGVLLVLLLTGLISFGLILSFKQNLTQAAAEGARAGAVAPAGESAAHATAATENAVASFDRDCVDASDGLTCVPPLVTDCGETIDDGNDDPAVPNCITVRLEYDYDNNPLLPKFPILANMYPKTMSASSTAQVNS
ncbi:MAG TPA: TadE/TadG family type IV pilus assembly protein [Ilumatobacteraceae bacterium]|nr:TadE/TadG family type IV pilus assembly protein [Ilumatobacteraceae bacterium]